MPDADPATPTAPVTPATTSQRTRRLVTGIVSSFGSRGVVALVPLALIPLTLPAMGSSLYGAWMAIVSVTAMLIWADLGLGSGLLTRMSKSFAHDDDASSRRDMLATYLLVGSLALTVGAVGTVVASLIDWAAFLGAPAGESGAIRRIVLVCLWCFAVNMPLSLVQRIQYASGQVSLSNMFTATGPLISLGLAALAVLTSRDPALIVLAATVGPLVANSVATVWFFTRHPRLRLGRADRAGAQMGQLLSLGSIFVVLSACSAVATNLDSLLIARLLDAEAVTSFSVPFRIMAAMGLVINLVNLPLWPANANAIAQGEVDWVRRTTLRMAVVSGGFVMLASAALLLFATPATHLLAQGEVEPDLRVFLALGAWWTVVAWTSPFMMVQNATGRLRWQLVGWLLFLAVSVPLKVIAIDQEGIWAGPAVGAVCYLAVVIPLNQIGYRRALKHSSAAAQPA